MGFVLGYTGVFYGQCSEICGANHAFIPIVVEVVPRDVFVEIVKEKLVEKVGVSTRDLSGVSAEVRDSPAEATEEREQFQ